MLNLINKVQTDPKIQTKNPRIEKLLYIKSENKKCSRAEINK